MSRILLADDSPHAQRMGERILREEGFEVVTVTDGQTALMRLADVDPDVVFADVSLPRRSGYEICSEIKRHPRHRHVRVILTAGLLEAFDEAQAKSVKCDGILKKPFEASVVLETIKPLIAAAALDRVGRSDGPTAQAAAASAPPASPLVAQPISRSAARPARETIRPVAAVPVRVLAAPPEPEPAPVDRERIRAAVVLALDAALPDMIDKITERILIALGE
ncbi:MAG TPA: response regulator [Bryobacteraceae bacterium]|nr:response regulator [Bryobacteraceae bacterium]